MKIKICLCYQCRQQKRGKRGNQKKRVKRYLNRLRRRTDADGEDSKIKNYYHA
jgi:hypothetical protein